MPPEQSVAGTNQRACVFVDAANLWAVQKARLMLLDYGELTSVIREAVSADEIRTYYYAAYPADGTRAYSLAPQHRFLVYLKRGLGFTVRKKALKRITTHDGIGAVSIEKGNMDVEIAIDALDQIDTYDIAVLCTGDSDFLPLVHYLQNHGKHVIAISAAESGSREIRYGVDRYYDIRDLPEKIWRRTMEKRS